jgi:hypothetical protein
MAVVIHNSGTSGRYGLRFIMYKSSPTFVESEYYDLAQELIVTIDANLLIMNCKHKSDIIQHLVKVRLKELSVKVKIKK